MKSPVMFPVSWVVVGLLLTGCQRIADVSGTVRVDGKPAKGLVVVFDPGTNDAPRGVATTAADGGYTIRRLGPGAKTGVPVGSYSVKVSYEVKGGANTFDIDISTN